MYSFQDCSAMQSEELGVGIDYQRQRQFTWMLLQWHVQIFKKPKYGETIVVGTWPYSFKNIKGGRSALTPLELRQKCREFAAKNLKGQGSLCQHLRYDG